MHRKTVEQFAEMGWIDRIEDPVGNMIKDLKRTRRGETLRIVEGEFGGEEWFHPAVLRQLALAVERGVVIQLIAGPSIKTEPVMTAQIVGDIRQLRTLQRWLSPLTRYKMLGSQWGQDEEGRFLTVTGCETTVKLLASMWSEQQNSPIGQPVPA